MDERGVQSAEPDLLEARRDPVSGRYVAFRPMPWSVWPRWLNVLTITVAVGLGLTVLASWILSLFGIAYGMWRIFH